MSRPGDIQALPPELLAHCFQDLDFVDLFSVAATCRLFRAAAGPCSEAWRRCCRRRWAGPLNTGLFSNQRQQSGTSEPAINWRDLFTHDNGWSGPRLSVSKLGAGGVSAAAVLDSEPSSGEPPLVGYAEGSTLYIAEGSSVASGTAGNGSHGSSGPRCRWRGRLPSGAAGQQPAVPITKVAVVEAGRGMLAAGSWMGHLRLCALQQSEEGSSKEQGDPPARVVASWHGCRFVAASSLCLHSLALARSFGGCSLATLSSLHPRPAAERLWWSCTTLPRQAACWRSTTALKADPTATGC